VDGLKVILFLVAGTTRSPSVGFSFGVVWYVVIIDAEGRRRFNATLSEELAELE
jgi:hypothetical protein